MKIKTISVTYGRKLNLGDYNSANLECSMWADLEDGDNPDAALAELRERAKASVIAQAEPFINRNGANKKAEKTFAGKVVDAGSNRAYAAGAYDDADAGIDPRDGMPFGDK